MDYSNIIAAIIGSATTVSTLFLGKWVDKHWNHKNNEDKKNSIVDSDFSNYMDAAEEINKELSYLRDKYGFNRTSLVEFHNGTSSLKGLSFKNGSMRYERVDNITNSIIMQYQNIPCSLSIDIMRKLEASEDGYIRVGQTDDPNLMILNKMYGVVESHNFRLGESLTNGCVSLVSTHDIKNLTKNDIDDIKAVCQRIHLSRTKYIKK